ncbi:MAG: methyltransferase domain-containing protein [Actinobacteria bacterium]|jgi:SAM-dependent methyltransferase|nr:methyltransferase domain-containing protein [Actinomycetota bacterium]MCL6104513.1 methyltransferase domain-containing protein [Actinomycetota bacterium]
MSSSDQNIQTPQNPNNILGGPDLPTGSAEMWDKRYSTEELVWSADPNVFVRDLVEGMPPGTAIDLGCGEGRNALWLAEKGWKTTGVDFSRSGIEKAKQRSKAMGLEVNWIVADLSVADLSKNWKKELTGVPPGFDLVVIAYLHLPNQPMRNVFKLATELLNPGGHLLVVGHDISNLEHGFGGPPIPEVLYSTELFATSLGNIQLERNEVLTRTVDTPDGERQALDTLAWGCKP